MIGESQASASSTTGSRFNPNSLSFSDSLTWTRGSHTLKFGGEYRRIEVKVARKGAVVMPAHRCHQLMIEHIIRRRFHQVRKFWQAPGAPA